jgi:hypothetical protein
VFFLGQAFRGCSKTTEDTGSLIFGMGNWQPGFGVLLVGALVRQVVGIRSLWSTIMCMPNWGQNSDNSDALSNSRIFCTIMISEGGSRLESLLLGSGAQPAETISLTLGGASNQYNCSESVKYGQTFLKF